MSGSDEGYAGSLNETTIIEQQQQYPTDVSTAADSIEDYLNNLNFNINYNVNNDLAFYIHDLVIDYGGDLSLFDFYDDEEDCDGTNYERTCNSEIKNDEFYEDFIDITAYLYEIDLNSDYVQILNEPDGPIDDMLTFANRYEACNLRVFTEQLEEYQRLLKLEQDQMSSMQDMFAYVDYIPEFVPYGTGVNDELDETLCNHPVIDQHHHYYGTGDIFENVYNDYNNDLMGDCGDSIDGLETISSDADSLSGGRMQIPRYTKSTRDQQFRKPCVYMLNDGQCLRADCRFAHDLHNITCKYWLEGECLKGDACEFLHGYPTIATQASTPADNADSVTSSSSSSFTFQYSSKLKKAQQHEQQQKKKIKDFNLDTQDFPELATVVASTVNNVEPDTNNENSGEQVTKPKTANKKSRKFKENILVSLSLPALQNSSRKKHII
jgi:hypothetical protein